MIEYTIDNEQALKVFCEKLAKKLPVNFNLYLHGELGAGKTCLTRHLLHALGYQGGVKSPTFTLVEPYEFDEHHVFHFDLYRLSDPSELFFMGIDDYFAKQALRIIEWPENAADVLPKPDIDVYINIINVDARQLLLQAHSDAGKEILQQV